MNSLRVKGDFKAACKKKNQDKSSHLCREFLLIESALRMLASWFITFQSYFQTMLKIGSEPEEDNEVNHCKPRHLGPVSNKAEKPTACDACDACDGGDLSFELFREVKRVKKKQGKTGKSLQSIMQIQCKSLRKQRIDTDSRSAQCSRATPAKCP